MKKKLLLPILFATVLFTQCDNEEKKFSGEACFTYVPNTVIIVNEAISFTNCSKDADNYLWNFGDGTISQEKTPTHSYSSAGIYTVTLVAQDEVLRDLNGDDIINEMDMSVNSDVKTATITISAPK